MGFDTHPWTLDEARFTYRAFGLSGDVRRAPMSRVRLPRDASFIVAAFVINELKDDDRAQALAMLLAAIAHGASVLIVEPISHRISPWWPEWVAAFELVGGRADEWHLRIEMPMFVKRLAQAAGLRPQVLTARSLFVSGRPRT